MQEGNGVMELKTQISSIQLNSIRLKSDQSQQNHSQWVEAFQSIGANEIILVTKHHDGFMYVYLLLSILGSFLQTIRITLLPIVRGEKEKVM